MAEDCAAEAAEAAVLAAVFAEVAEVSVNPSRAKMLFPLYVDVYPVKESKSSILPSSVGMVAIGVDRLEANSDVVI